jgi:hypothetical protein
MLQKPAFTLDFAPELPNLFQSVINLQLDYPAPWLLNQSAKSSTKILKSSLIEKPHLLFL